VCRFLRSRRQPKGNIRLASSSSVSVHVLVNTSPQQQKVRDPLFIFLTRDTTLSSSERLGFASNNCGLRSYSLVPACRASRATAGIVSIMYVCSVSDHLSTRACSHSPSPPDPEFRSSGPATRAHSDTVTAAIWRSVNTRAAQQCWSYHPALFVRSGRSKPSFVSIASRPSDNTCSCRTSFSFVVSKPAAQHSWGSWASSIRGLGGG
jgi:hypothetical protein